MYQHVNLWFVSYQKGYKFYDYFLTRKGKRFQNWYYFHYYELVELVFVILYIPVSSKNCLHCCTDTWIWCLSTKAMQQWLLSYTWGCKECIITYHGVFLQWGESRGCTREEMISFYDSEGNVPLHSAVHGGDIKVNMYRLCVKRERPVIPLSPLQP